HVNADGVYTEVLGEREASRQETGVRSQETGHRSSLAPVPCLMTPGEAPRSPGKLLVTDLVNRAMPLVRYQIGDVVVPSDRVCRCGRGLPLVERVEGREADYVLTP